MEGAIPLLPRLVPMDLTAFVQAAEIEVFGEMLVFFDGQRTLGCGGIGTTVVSAERFFSAGSAQWPRKCAYSLRSIPQHCAQVYWYAEVKTNDDSVRVDTALQAAGTVLARSFGRGEAARIPRQAQGCQT